ncbi:ferrochelatase [Nemorincola caseinilytica]|uniref:Ferrochelatase n=1 Tax=Nemorincola caseinilytica TaxID=2054315 RepID=A0ABP8N352_9BACT
MIKDSNKRGIILMNLGSPDTTEVKDVRRYLDEFLMDERVIDSPYIWRSILVKGIINPFRAPKSAEAYRAIWTKDGSPLVHITRQLRDALQEKVAEPVVIAMRYGNPDIRTAYEQLLHIAPGIEEVVLLPLYPHYAMSSFETASVEARKVHADGKYSFKLSVVRPFYNHPAYIAAMAESMREYVTGNDKHVLFSYHSIPEKHIHMRDITESHCLRGECCTTPSATHSYCYRHQCLETTRLVVEALGLPKERYSIAFQSKLGRAEWLRPATTLRMTQMPAEGIKDLLVVCPSFVSDCLETLEEIAIREKENFMHAGGNSYEYIPCMNTRPAWVSAVETLLREL